MGKNNKKKVDKKNNKYKFPPEFTKLLNLDRILKNTDDYENLKIKLVHDEIKGTSVYATKTIEMDEVIAYYKLKVFSNNSYKSPTNYIYAFTVYGASGKEYKSLIGDIDSECIPEPIDNIPFWGLFINEPSNDQDINSSFDTNYDYNFTKFNRKRMKTGIYLTYKIIASRDIDVGEEITIYYGSEYERDYELKI